MTHPEWELSTFGGGYYHFVKVDSPFITVRIKTVNVVQAWKILIETVK